MRCIEERRPESPYETGNWNLYTKGLSSAFLDIETTGLSANRDAVILGGMLAGEGSSRDALLLRQYLAASPKEEPSLLETYLGALSGADIWITYNGDTFDLPFLARRLRKNGISDGLPLFQSIDLYRIFRRYSPMAELLPDLRQTTLEEAMGLSPLRRDKITGKESIGLYADYVRTKDTDMERAILLHNHDDLLMLRRLMAILDKLDLHRLMFQRGFLVAREEKRILAENITLGKNFLRATGRTEGISSDADAFEDLFQWSHDRRERRFTLTIPCLYEQKATFVDLEAADFDCRPLTEYPGYASGFLLFHDGQNPYYREINHTIKIILTEILKKL